jgi:NADH:ubiquinone oxidoreductase subunit 2 (subunit N)
MLFLVFSSISSLIGGFIGICQVNIRFILAYSSISHAG